MLLRGGQLSHHWTVPLINLLRDLDAIGEVRFSVRVVLPREVQSLRLEPVEPGSVAAAGDLRVTLEKTDSLPPARPGTAAQKRYDFRVEPPEGRRLCWLAPYPSGAQADGWAFPYPSGQFTASLANDPSQFLFKVLSAGDELNWEFSLRDIPLRRPPRKLEPARFEGHAAPVRVAAARVTDTGVDLRVVSNCQKDFDTLELKLIYKDGDGRALREAGRKWSRSQQLGFAVESLFPQLTLARGPSVAPEAGEDEWQLQDAAAPPEGTRSVTATVTRVLFKDGTTWPP
jgi:hypothetical protein